MTSRPILDPLFGAAPFDPRTAAAEARARTARLNSGVPLPGARVRERPVVVTRLREDRRIIQPMPVEVLHVAAPRRIRAPAQPLPDPASSLAAVLGDRDYLCTLSASTGYRALQASVARRYGITTARLTGKRRIHRAVVARQEIMWLLHVAAGFGLSSVARTMRVDHTTVLHGARQHQRRLDAQAGEQQGEAAA